MRILRNIRLQTWCTLMRPGRRWTGERSFVVIKRVFGSGHVLVTSLPMVRVKLVFACLCFNLFQLGQVEWRRVAQSIDLLLKDGSGRREMNDAGPLGMFLGVVPPIDRAWGNMFSMYLARVCQ